MFKPQKRPQYRQLPLVDADGLYRVPVRFYLLLLLLLRPYICWVLALTLPADQRDVLNWIYPQPEDFMRACGLALPVLLLFAALTQRVPFDVKQRRGRGKRFWFGVWRHGRGLLIMITAVDLYWTFTHLPEYVALYAPWLLLAPLGLILGLFWLVGSRQLPAIFREWPDDKMD